MQFDAGRVYAIMGESGSGKTIAFPCLTCHLRAETTNAPTAFWRSLRAYVKRKCYTLLSLLAGLDLCAGGSITYEDVDLKTINRD